LQPANLLRFATTNTEKVESFTYKKSDGICKMSRMNEVQIESNRHKTEQSTDVYMSYVE